MFFPDTPEGRETGLASLRRLDTRLTASHADTHPDSVAAQAAALTGWERARIPPGNAWPSSGCPSWSAPGCTTA
jgi:hypothetical protein